MTTPHIIRLDSCTSTNSTLAAMARTEPHGTVVTVDNQTAGRGQRGNTWESEPGKNITMSMLLKPQHIEASDQFVISEAVSMALVDLLNEHITNHDIAVKWPNDIYVDNKKICGILIENSVCAGRIEHSIAGIGLNINQMHFISDAPNPISMIHFSGREHDVDEILAQLSQKLLDYCDRYDAPSGREDLHALYIKHLWRRDGFFPYIDATSGEAFEACITDVETNGLLHLTDIFGHERIYAFKEVVAVL